jgi:hypothetical protein
MLGFGSWCFVAVDDMVHLTNLLFARLVANDILNVAIGPFFYGKRTMTYQAYKAPRVWVS